MRNDSRMIASLRFGADGRRARLLNQRASAADHVLITVKALRGRTLYVDSTFDEPVSSQPHEVVTDPAR